MKKVLLITYSYPPYTYGLRAYSFKKYLKDYGYDCTVLAVRGTSMTQDVTELEEVIYVGYDNYGNDKISIRDRIFRYDKSMGSYAYINTKNKAQEILENNKIDLIIATSCNVLFVFTIAMEMSHRFKIPWIADVRDITEQFGNKLNFLKINFIRYFFIRNKILKTASLITTISKWHKNYLSKILAKDIHIIHNGFDPEILSPCIEKYKPYKKLIILYAGTIFDYHYEAFSMLTSAITELGNDYELRIIGKISVKCNKLINNKNNVIKKESTEFNKIKNAYCESDVFVILNNKAHVGVVGTKIFEYMTYKKPIINIINNDESVDEILKETNTGTTNSTTDDIKNTLIKIKKIKDVMNNTKLEIHDEALTKYSRREQSKQLANLLVTV